MLKVAEQEPVAAGVKLTPIAQFAPATTVAPQVLVCWKSPALLPPTPGKEPMTRPGNSDPSRARERTGTYITAPV